MMKIPAELKIGGHTVKVERKRALKGKGVNYLGLAIRSMRQILLAKRLKSERLPESSKAQTFLHEIVHTVAHVYGVELKEREVAALSEGLFQVFRDNDLDFRRVK